ETSERRTRWDRVDPPGTADPMSGTDPRRGQIGCLRRQAIDRLGSGGTAHPGTEFHRQELIMGGDALPIWAGWRVSRLDVLAHRRGGGAAAQLRGRPAPPAPHGPPPPAPPPPPRGAVPAGGTRPAPAPSPAATA